MVPEDEKGTKDGWRGVKLPRRSGQICGLLFDRNGKIYGIAAPLWIGAPCGLN